MPAATVSTTPFHGVEGPDHCNLVDDLVDLWVKAGGHREPGAL